MPSRPPLARMLAALLVVAPAAALADPPAATAPAATTATPPAAAKPVAPVAAKPLPALKSAAVAAKPAASPAAKPKGTGFGKKKKKNQDDVITGPIATYPGFRMLDGGASRVTVALSKKVTVTELKAEGKLTYRIQGVQVPTRTNRLPLLTGFFATPVTRAELVPRDGDVDLVIDVRNGSATQYRIVENDRGAELQVDFPKLAAEAADGGTTATPSEATTSRPVTTKSLDSTAY